MSSKNNPQRPIIIYQNGDLKKALPIGNREPSPLFYGLSRFLLILLIPLVIAYLAERLTNPSGENPFIALYADPTRDYQPTPDLSWKTPLPDGWLKTPENLQAVLSKTPITIEPSLTPAPTNTPAPTQTRTPEPTQTPAPTIDTDPQETARADLIAAETDIKIEGMRNRAAMVERLIDFLIRSLGYICAAGFSVFALALLILVIVRIRKEIADIHARERAAALLADPILAYSKSAQPEVRDVFELLLANKKYYESEQLPAADQKKIMRFSYLENINSDDWTRATNSLVKRGYAMKSERRPTLLKYSLTLGIMLEIINRGLYLDRDAIFKIAELTPSQNGK